MEYEKTAAPDPGGMRALHRDHEGGRDGRIHDVPAPPFYLKFRDMEGIRLDRWFKYDFILPGTLLMESGGRPVDAAPGDESRTVRLHSCQTLTPETAASTHYFFQQSHPADMGDANTTRLIYEQLLVAFEEDRRMITAQSRNLATGSAEPMMPLWMDAALLQFRRLRELRIAAEQGRR